MDNQFHPTLKVVRDQSLISLVQPYTYDTIILDCENALANSSFLDELVKVYKYLAFRSQKLSLTNASDVLKDLLIVSGIYMVIPCEGCTLKEYETWRK